MRFLIIVAAFLIGSAATAQDPRPIDAVVILRDQLNKETGSFVKMGNIDVSAALRGLATALIDIDARIAKIEQRK